MVHVALLDTARLRKVTPTANFESLRLMAFRALLLLTLTLIAVPMIASANVVPSFGLGRTRTDGPPSWCKAAPTSGNDTGARFFKLLSMQVIEASGPSFKDFVPDPIRVKPVVLLVPLGYSRDIDLLRSGSGISGQSIGMRFSAIYPTFKPISCTDSDDDRIDVSVSMNSTPSTSRAMTKSLREYVEDWPALNVTLTGASVPSGFEEALTRAITIDSTKERVRTTFLSYRDENGQLMQGICNPDAEVPECEFTVDVPGTYILVDYRIVYALLPHRREIEIGLRDMIRKWVADAN